MKINGWLKAVTCLLTTLCLMLPSLTAWADIDPDSLLKPKGDVLLIYDEPDLLSLTQNILTAFDRKVDSVQILEYEKGMTDEYRYVVLLTPTPFGDIGEISKVLCIGEGFEIPGVTMQKSYGEGMEITAGDFYQYLNYIEEFTVISEFKGKSFGQIALSFDRQYPFGIRTGSVYSVPYLSESNISTFALGEMLPDFFDSHYQGGIYVILQDVFAFSDLDMLCNTADEMYLANIPFIVKVMPLYTNTEQDAFLRYAQALRYVESRNGAIVMTPAIVNGKATDEEIEEMTAIATDALVAEGISVLPSIEGFYCVDMEYLKEVKSPSKRYQPFSFDVGVLENLPRTDLQLEQMVANLNGRWYEFGSYREKFDLKSKLFLEVPLDEQIQARVDTTQTPLFFSIGSIVLTAFVSIMLLVIGLLIYLSRVNYKRKFTKKAG